MGASLEAQWLGLGPPTAYATILVCAVLGGLVVLMMWKAPAEQTETKSEA